MLSLIFARGKQVKAHAKQVAQRSVSQRLAVFGRYVVARIASLCRGTAAPVADGAIVTTPAAVNVRVFLAAYMIK